MGTVAEYAVRELWNTLHHAPVVFYESEEASKERVLPGLLAAMGEAIAAAIRINELEDALTTWQGQVADLSQVNEERQRQIDALVLALQETREILTSKCYQTPKGFTDPYLAIEKINTALVPFKEKEPQP